MKPELLLVDDDRCRAEMIAQSLGDRYRCTIATNADDALRTLARDEVAAVLTDFDLQSEGTGLTVLRGAEYFRPRTARLLYTRYYSDGLVQVARQAVRPHEVLDAREAEFLGTLRGALARVLGVDTPGPGQSDSAPAEGDEVRWCATAPVTLRCLAGLRTAAGGTGPVFAYGEPGSGKHLAQATLLRWRATRTAAERGGRGEGRVHLVAVPSLRERREDIPALCERLLAHVAAEASAGAARLAPEALEALMRRDWWGNVTELHGTVCRAWERVRSTGRRVIEPGDLPGDIDPCPGILERAEVEGRREAMLIELRTTGSVRKAAELDQHTRPNYKRWMNKYGILRLDRPGSADTATDG